MFTHDNFESDRNSRLYSRLYSRLFDKGDFKYIILQLVKEKPYHGYEIIRVLEKQFHGLYSPSAGSVYPTLQLLEEMELVSSTEQDGKKIYTITDAGKEYLKKHQKILDKITSNIKSRSNDINRDQFRETMRDIRDIARLFVIETNNKESKKAEDIRKIISKARTDIENLAGI
jgi:DNA-binding PadR family transcriptional regulator